MIFASLREGTTKQSYYGGDIETALRLAQITSFLLRKIFLEMYAPVPVAEFSPAPASAPIEKIVASRYGRVYITAVFATMRGFCATGLTQLALGEAVPCRPGGTTAEAYKRSKGINDVSSTALALQKPCASLKLFIF